MVKAYPRGNVVAVLNSPKQVKILNCEVVFGTPGRRCEGSGLCKVYTITGAKHLEPHPRRVPVMVLIDSKKNPTIRIDQSHCPENLLQELFQGARFVMEENFELPRYFARKLGIAPFVVPAGDYPIVCNGNWLDIVF